MTWLPLNSQKEIIPPDLYGDDLNLQVNSFLYFLPPSAQ